MNFVGYILIGILCCTIVSGDLRPLNPTNVQTFTVDTRDEQNYRLPNNTKPETYDITIRTTVDEAVNEDNDFSFEGTVVINIKALEETSTITLHARQLTITDIRLKSANGGDIQLEWTYSIVPELVILATKSKLEKDKNYLVTIAYTGELRKDNAGFYRSSYLDANGLRHWLATTQFESTDARHAFPCYDEPAFKANFTIHIDHHVSYNAISNTHGTTSAPDSEGRVKTTFATTPPTSTYLIAFIVSDFGYTETNASDNNPTHQRVFTSKNKLSQTAYALDEGVKILNAISKYVSVPFSLPKMDQAAIPDFRAGAMENWGLVTYREPYLLYDPNVHLPSRQLTISTVIAHEFGHQWFGNLVSPKWWTYIWLNEGFATLFEYLGAGLVHPDWNIFSYFITNQLQPVLRTDAKSTTRAMTTYAESPSGVSGLFDSIAYAKSGSVIRMFLHALGEDTFKKGLTYYLNAQAHSVADEDNLFENLNKAAKEDKMIADPLTVKELFGSWSNQKGFPYLKVVRNSNGSVTLLQGEYDAVYKPDEPNTRTWWIPYNFATRKVPEFAVTTPTGWFPKGQNQTLIPEDNTKWTKDDWLVFNRQQTGFYRVWYDQHNYDLINKELNSGNLSSIHENNRAQYIDDLNDFVSTGRVPPKTLFSALTYLSNESHYAPWVSARRALLDLNQIFAASKKQHKFNDFVAKIVTNFYKNKTLDAIENEPLFDKLSRNIAVELACRFGVPQCLSETYIKFHDFVKNGNKPSQDNRGLVFANGIRNATSKEINKFWNYLVATNSDDERKEIITSLGNIQNSTYIKRVLNKTLGNVGTRVTKADLVSIIQSISGGNQSGLAITITFLGHNLEKVNTTIGSVPTILTSVASKVVTAEVQTDFVNLLDLAKSKNLITDAEIETLKNTVNDKVDWQKNNVKQFEDALSKAGPKSAASMTVLLVLLVLIFCLVHWNAE
ncbi:aminopeptidase N-like [Sitodiplosis mosellana]|uniref:aminopeptidase N-like n=1 Tax=Sitodiplosis mosellana TaxID=263140 RepID=UPI002443D81E|nr:aminopeptidase N-like [Sitodiplosis mosellana]